MHDDDDDDDDDDGRLKSSRARTFLHEKLHQPLLRRDVVLQTRGEVRVAELVREALTQALARARVIRQPQRDDLRGEEEVDHVRVVHLHERADHAQGRQPQVLERPRLAHRVQERVQEQRDVRVQEERARVRMRRDALQERERVAHAVRRVVRQRRRRQERVYRHDLLKQRGDDAERVPQDRREVREHVSLLAQIEEGILPRLRVLQSRDESLHRVPRPGAALRARFSPRSTTLARAVFACVRSPAAWGVVPRRGDRSATRENRRVRAGQLARWRADENPKTLIHRRATSVASPGTSPRPAAPHIALCVRSVPTHFATTCVVDVPGSETTLAPRRSASRHSGCSLGVSVLSLWSNTPEKTISTPRRTFFRSSARSFGTVTGMRGSTLEAAAAAAAAADVVAVSPSVDRFPRAASSSLLDASSAAAFAAAFAAAAAAARACFSAKTWRAARRAKNSECTRVSTSNTVASVPDFSLSSTPLSRSDGPTTPKFLHADGKYMYRSHTIKFSEYPVHTSAVSSKMTAAGSVPARTPSSFFCGGDLNAPNSSNPPRPITEPFITFLHGSSSRQTSAPPDGASSTTRCGSGDEACGRSSLSSTPTARSRADPAVGARRPSTRTTPSSGACGPGPTRASAACGREARGGLSSPPRTASSRSAAFVFAPAVPAAPPRPTRAFARAGRSASTRRRR
eukprot:31198-Pelagococcus_subviridis.AAC.27